jgi:hypothetical protein
LPAARLAALGATMELHHGLLAAADQARGAFGVGVLRRDGVIIPFAAFSGKRWSSPWPAPALALTVPVDLRALPKRWWGPTPALETWQATTIAGPRALRVVQPEWVDVHCLRQIGLRTDYRSERSVPPATEQPYPKDGLAVSPSQTIEPIETAAAESADVRRLIPELHKAFNSAERIVEDRFGHLVIRRAREGVEPSIEAVYAVGDSPRVYYVEAVRRYRKLGQSLGECAATAFGTGWFVRDGAGVRTLTMAVDLLNCNRYGASYMLPFGVMRLNDRLYWLAQFSGWEHERYVVLEIKSKTVDVIVNVRGGSC